MSHSAILKTPETWWQKAAATIRRIIGAPDYERYVRHMEKHHPECALLSHDAFVTERMTAKYTRPGSRCC
jgi:uncharacterized short protein YbdD (DUF466 family)